MPDFADVRLLARTSRLSDFADALATARTEAGATAPAATKRPKRPKRSVRRLLLTMIVVGVTGIVAGVGSYSAYTATTSNGGDSFAAGSVALSDNHVNGTALISLTNAKPGDTDTGCIKVSFSGSLSATVHLYGAASGALAPYLTLTVTRGTDSNPSYRSCANFTPDATNYIGQGSGVVYSGNLSDFPSSYAAGIVDPAVGGGTQTWVNGDGHSYKFTITAQDNNASQGLNGAATFTWEAHNL